MEGGMLQNTWMEILNFFLHGMNTISCLIDIFITDRPWRFAHFIYTHCFGLYYITFSIIYWAAGGKGVCSTDDNGDPTDECEDYIYPILDWGGNIGLTIGSVIVVMLVIPLFQAFWLGMHNLRKLLAKQFEKKSQNST